MNDSDSSEDMTDSLSKSPSTRREEIADLSLLEVQELRNKLGIKKFNQLYGTKKKSSQSSVSQKGERKKRIKNMAPTEISSKRPPRSGDLASTLKKPAVTRDPRFDDLSGTYDEQLFKRSYKFIDRIKSKEAKQVQKIAEDEEMDYDTRKKAKDILTRMGQKKKAKQEFSAEDKVERTLKAERKKAIKAGQKPYFMKSADKKKLVLAEKYKELKQKGQLDSFMKKKRKQNAKGDQGAKPVRTER